MSRIAGKVWSFQQPSFLELPVSFAEDKKPASPLKMQASFFSFSSYCTVKAIVKLPGLGSGNSVAPVVVEGFTCAAETATFTLVVPAGVSTWVAALPHPDMLPMEEIVNRTRATIVLSPAKPSFLSRLRAISNRRPENPAIPHGSPLAVGGSGGTLVLMMNCNVIGGTGLFGAVMFEGDPGMVAQAA
jgi:hypothetical protein